MRSYRLRRPGPDEVESRESADDFLSGTSGQVAGIRRTSSAIAADAICDAIAAARLEQPRLRRAARASPRRRVLGLGIERDDMPNVLAPARAELLAAHHDVDFVATVAGSRGKFENLRDLLIQHPPDRHDWLIVVDDDVTLPAGFLDSFIFLAERFGLKVAQPAHRRRSHAAWAVTQRRPGSVARETSFVEIGPVCAFHSMTFETLLPFPPLRFGWGLDAHWSALARERGWRLGIVDATPVGHGLRPIAATYDRAAAIAEGREFLAGRPYVRTAQARRTLVTHRSW